ncbi:MAG: hypothetical protein RIF33_18880 [Cyclobacteriaceae bacterium]
MKSVFVYAEAMDRHLLGDGSKSQFILGRDNGHIVFLSVDFSFEYNQCLTIVIVWFTISTT